MIFTDAERDYLRHQRLGRLATIQPNGTLQNSPVGFRLDPDTDTITIIGYRLADSRKFRNLQADPRTAFVVDDLPSVQPWRVRCVEIRGDGVAVPPGDPDGPCIRLRPRQVISFGVDEDMPPHEMTASNRKVEDGWRTRRPRSAATG